MFVSSGTIVDRIALRTSAVDAVLTPRGCDLIVPFTGTITPQHQSKLTCALRRNMIELRYGMRLKGLAVSVDGQVLTVSATASKFAIARWLDSGEFVQAVDAAVRTVVR